MRLYFTIFLFGWCCLSTQAQIPDTLFRWNPSEGYDLQTIDSLRAQYGDEMVFAAFEKGLITQLQFDFSEESSIGAYMAQAETFLNAKYYRPDFEQNLLLTSMGDQMLTILSDSLKLAIDQKIVSAFDPFVQYVRHRLAESNKFIAVKTPNWRKVIGYVLQGRFEYVFRKAFTTYLADSFQILAVLLGLLGLIFFRKKIVRIFRKKLPEADLTGTKLSGFRMKGTVLVVFILLGLSLLTQKACAQTTTPMQFVKGCDLKRLEFEIDEIERQTKGALFLVSLKGGDTLMFTQYKSVWDESGCIRPSLWLGDLVSCKDILIRNELYLELFELKALADKKKHEANVLLTTLSTVQRPLSAPSELPAKEAAVKNTMYIHYAKGESDYHCFIVNPKSEASSILFLWKDEKGEPFYSFDRCIEYFKVKKKKQPIMLMNAGIFNEKFAPLGAFYANGKKLRAFNAGKGEGNFFLDPAGVFIIEKDGTAVIKTKEGFMLSQADTVNIKHATQSGPMLVVDGKIHPAFNPKSTNFYIRNGVGVMADGNVIFIMSEQPVTFYEFAQVFRDRFKCQNALYLDGAISQMYLPGHKLLDTKGKFAGMIAVFPN